MQQCLLEMHHCIKSTAPFVWNNPAEIKTFLFHLCHVRLLPGAGSVTNHMQMLQASITPLTQPPALGEQLSGAEITAADDCEIGFCNSRSPCLRGKSWTGAFAWVKFISDSHGEPRANMRDGQREGGHSYAAHIATLNFNHILKTGPACSIVSAKSTSVRLATL